MGHLSWPRLLDMIRKIHFVNYSSKDVRVLTLWFPLSVLFETDQPGLRGAFPPLQSQSFTVCYFEAQTGSSVWESRRAGDRGKSATRVLVLVRPQGPKRNRAVSGAADCSALCQPRDQINSNQRGPNRSVTKHTCTQRETNLASEAQTPHSPTTAHKARGGHPSVRTPCNTRARTRMHTHVTHRSKSK